jgi:hypothetical protein
VTNTKLSLVSIKSNVSISILIRHIDVEKTFSAWSTVDCSRFQKERWLPTMWKYQFKQPDSNRWCGKTNLSNPKVTNLNNLNRTSNATIRTYILHQKTFFKMITIKNDYRELNYREFQLVCPPGSSEQISHQLIDIFSISLKVSDFLVNSYPLSRKSW